MFCSNPSRCVRSAVVSMAAGGLVLALAAASPAAAAPTLLRTFNDPLPTSEDNFGRSVALDGNRVLIGAALDDTQGIDVGQAHLFDVLTGALLATFDDPTPSPGDGFGFSVALQGNRALIGARRDDSQGDDVGQAHLFDVLTGALLATFDDPTPTSGDNFGGSVALGSNRVLIGAPLDDSRGSNRGQAHLFDFTGALLATFDDPTPTIIDLFGVSVALDGSRALIGAPGDDSSGANRGQAHLFGETGTLLGTFGAPNPAKTGNFGFSVALEGNRMLIGAPIDDSQATDGGQAYLLDAATGALLATFVDPTPGAFDEFGRSVALDGNRVLIGAEFDDSQSADAGQAHLFDATTGVLLATFDNPTPTIFAAGRFGNAVALDGNRVLIGEFSDDSQAGNRGQAHLFSLSVAPVPAPPTLGLMAGTLVLAGFAMRRRSRHRIS